MTGDYWEPVSTEQTRGQFRTLEKLMMSFSNHLNLLKDQTLKDESIKSFQAAICNPEVTKHLFGKSFEPKEDPHFFEECPKSSE